MVNRQDIRTLNENVQEVMEAIDELENLHEQNEKDDITVEPSAFVDAQEQMKDAVSVLVNYSNDMVDRTDVLENDNGNPLVHLPNEPLQRSGGNASLPQR